MKSVIPLDESRDFAQFGVTKEQGFLFKLDELRYFHKSLEPKRKKKIN